MTAREEAGRYAVVVGDGVNSVGTAGKQSLPNDKEVQAVALSFFAIPTHAQRDKIRHKAKQKPGCYYIGRSRKPKDLKQRAPVRDSTSVYHARTTATIFVREFLKLPGVAERLAALRARRTAESAQAAAGSPLIDLSMDSDQDDNAEQQKVLQPRDSPAQWPNDVTRMSESVNPEEVKFRDAGRLGRCTCRAECFRDDCSNALAGVYCARNNCTLKGRSSNASMVRPTLKLFNSRVGLGVYSETALEVGDIVGEYCGILCPYDGVRDLDEPGVRLKYNSGYTLLMRTRSTRRKFVYIEDAQCGGITRFINHSCAPNAKLVEMRNRRCAKVFVVVEHAIEAGSEVAVDYGDSVWFECVCGSPSCRTKKAKEAKAAEAAKATAAKEATAAAASRGIRSGV